MSNQSISSTLRTGWIVIALLAVFTIIEFIVAITTDGAVLIVLLTVIAVIKAGLIIQYFMHFGQLWVQLVDIWNGIMSATDGEDK
jgi:heme/copper-type cytochrome/quinol oxidase subunit 4